MYQHVDSKFKPIGKFRLDVKARLGERLLGRNAPYPGMGVL